MSGKGVEFTGIDDERIPPGMRSRWRPERLEAWVKAHNERWKIVDHCEHKDCLLPDGSKRPLIAEEIEPHKLKHLGSVRERQIVGMLLHYKTTDKDREAVRKILNE